MEHEGTFLSGWGALKNRMQHWNRFIFCILICLPEEIVFHRSLLISKESNCVPGSVSAEVQNSQWSDGIIGLITNPPPHPVTLFSFYPKDLSRLSLLSQAKRSHVNHTDNMFVYMPSSWKGACLNIWWLVRVTQEQSPYGLTLR